MAGSQNACNANPYRNGLTGIDPTITPDYYGNCTLLLNPALCTLQTCDLSMASFDYVPTLGGNAFFAVAFAVYLLVQLFLGIKYKTWGYMAAMILGLVLELVGYIARVMLHNDPFIHGDFIMYLVTLTIAPALLTAAIYLCLARIINVFGAHLSFFKPRTYTIVFCGCDLISLVLQALGGGIAATAHNDSNRNNLGKNIMLAGLGFQVFSLILFCGCAGEFAQRAWSQRGSWNSHYLNLIHSRLFKSFMVGLVTAVITIFIRCVYRCAELSGGFHGSLFRKDESLYMLLEPVMIFIAASCLTILHPGICFQGTFAEVSFSFRTRKNGSNMKLDRMGSDEENQGSREHVQFLGNQNK